MLLVSLVFPRQIFYSGSVSCSLSTSSIITAHNSSYLWSQVPSGRGRVPTRTGKPGKMGRHFPDRENSWNCEETGKVRENHTKYWKTWRISDKCYLLFLNELSVIC